MKPPCFLVKIPMKSQFFLVESHEIAIFNHHLVFVAARSFRQVVFCRPMLQTSSWTVWRWARDKVQHFTGVHQQTWYDLMFFFPYG